MWRRNEGGSETDLGIRDEPDASGFQGRQQDVRKESVRTRIRYHQDLVSVKHLQNSTPLRAKAKRGQKSEAKSRKTLWTHSATLAPTR